MSYVHDQHPSENISRMTNIYVYGIIDWNHSNTNTWQFTSRSLDDEIIIITLFTEL